MSVLKAGDKVICNDATGPYIYLDNGREYTVEWVSGSDVKLVEYDGTTKVWRFSLNLKANKESQ